MGLLYKDKEDITFSVAIKQHDGIVKLEFEADCGKFGADETLAIYELTPLRLLQILNNANFLDCEDFGMKNE